MPKVFRYNARITTNGISRITLIVYLLILIVNPKAHPSKAGIIIAKINAIIDIREA